jgi:sugar lactone lactonase YvrE
MLENSYHPPLRPAVQIRARANAKAFQCPLVSKYLPLVVLLAVILSPQSARSQEQEEIKGVPAEPADAQQIRDQIAAVQKLQPTLPDHGAPLYFLAVAKERLRDTLGALALLKECIALHEGFDPSGDPAFLELKDSADFTALIESVHTEFPAVLRAREAFRTTEKDLIPDGLAYDKRRNVFYLGSLNRRKIVEIGRDGNVSDFVPEGRFALLPVRGISVDSSDDSVWADSFSDDGQAELMHLDGTGKLMGRFKPAGATKHGFNNLVIRKSGEVITTDSLANAILRFDPALRTFKVLQVHRPLFYPSGIALGDDRTLYVTDSLGVVRVDLANGESRDVDPGPKSTLAGIDGLYWYKGSLIGIQIGIGSPRVAAFRLSSDGLRVTRTTVLENRSHFCASPTTGAIVGSDLFFFVANSHMEDMNDGKVMDVTQLEPARVGVLRLP